MSKIQEDEQCSVEWIHGGVCGHSEVYFTKIFDYIEDIKKMGAINIMVDGIPFNEWKEPMPIPTVMLREDCKAKIGSYLTKLLKEM